MKIEIDTSKMRWIEIPGHPTLASFLTAQRDARFNCNQESLPLRQKPEIGKAVLSAATLVRLLVPTYQYNRLYGYVPEGVDEEVYLLADARGRFGGESDRIVAFSNDLAEQLTSIFGTMHMFGVTNI